MLKEIIYTGLGGAVTFKERIERELEALADKGKLSREDTEAFLANLQERGETEEAELKAKIKAAVREAVDELGLATKADIEALKDILSK